MGSIRRFALLALATVLAGCTSFEQCKGEVILVKLWGVNCGPCLRSMPEVREAAEKFGVTGYGLAG